MHPSAAQLEAERTEKDEVTLGLPGTGEWL